MGPRTKLSSQSGMLSAKMSRKRFREPSPSGEMRWTMTDSRSKELSVWYGSATTTNSHKLGTCGTTIVKSWITRLDCIYARWSLRRDSSSSGVSLRSVFQHLLWNAKGIICYEPTWRLGENITSTASTWCMRIWQYSASRRTAIAGCLNVVTMLFVRTKKRRNSLLWNRLSKETANQQSKNSTKISKRKQCRLWGLARAGV